jgi:NAD(P)-dependent dehydrogenase (short-subunit alcohol dehydrogenase family)
MSVNSSLSGQVILVTGAARGIGLGIVRHLAARGVIVCLADIQQQLLQDVVEQLRKDFPEATFESAVVDIGNSSQVEDWVVGVKKQFGKINGCVNNAAIMHQPGPITSITDEAWDRVIRTNLTGTFNCLRSELKHTDDGGSIVNLSSVSGLFGSPFMGAYSASKHGIIGLSRTAAHEAESRKIRVNAVCPGVIETPLLRELTEQAGGALTDESLVAAQIMKRLAEPADVAPMVGFLLGSGSSFMTGGVYDVSGGFNA